jgi:DNA-binding NarL/FixJ family response regulator/tRNA A-37 threonylcarbamoyl transferase component Bud32
MALRILMVDDHAEFRTLLRHHLLARWPGAALREHDPLTQGPLPPDFKGEELDLVLLDYHLGGGEDGFAYLKRFRAIREFPPVIMLTAQGNEELAVRAIKGGAADYIPKQTMTHDRLVSAVQGALDSRQPIAVVAAEPPVPTAELPPTQLSIAGYKLSRCLAQGGAGTVYLGREERDGKDVVVKVMSQRLATGEESKEAQRLQREYELIRKVDSPRIVKLKELGVAAGHVYLVMEYFAHGSLREHIRGPLPRAEALDFVRQIATALEIIHRAGILHRDLKPANVMRRRDGTLALIDFGTAKSVGQSNDLTRTGTVVGTPHYMSPEQCAGQDLTPASDLYALGVMFYEMLTGALPYTAATPLAVLYKHQYAPLPQLPPEHKDLQPILETLLAKHPEERYPRARDFLAVLPVA